MLYQQLVSRSETVPWNLIEKLRSHIIYINMGITSIIKSEKDILSTNFTYENMLKSIIQTPISKDYKFLDLIGKGSYAEVYRGQSVKTKNLRAIKRIDRRKHAKIEPLLLNQFENLKQIDHPNILKVYEIYQDQNYYHIVTQLCLGHQLFEVLHKNKYFPEEEACIIFHQMVSAVMHMHEKKIMHRDLKPENMMYHPETKILKIIDFGSAVSFEGSQMMHHRRVGTSYYIAPEVLNRFYNYKCDFWSIGVILYVLLCGEPPFKGKGDDEILEKVKQGVFTFKHKNWQTISLEAKILIKSFLKLNPNQRPSLQQVMKHNWIIKFLKKENLDFEGQKSMEGYLSNMKKFKDIKSKGIESGVLVFIVNFIKNSNDEAELIKCFHQLDLNGDGLLSKEQLSIGLSKYLKVSHKEAVRITEGIFKKVDTNASGFIDYSQFIVSTSNMEVAVTQQNISIAFDFMDKDKNGSLSVSEIRGMLGENIPQDIYVQMMKGYKLNKQGEISKQDFIEIMQKIISEHSQY